MLVFDHFSVHILSARKQVVQKVDVKWDSKYYDTLLQKKKKKRFTVLQLVTYRTLSSQAWSLSVTKTTSTNIQLLSFTTLESGFPEPGILGESKHDIFDIHFKIQKQYTCSTVFLILWLFPSHLHG